MNRQEMKEYGYSGTNDKEEDYHFIGYKEVDDFLNDIKNRVDEVLEMSHWRGNDGEILELLNKLSKDLE